MKAKIVVAAGLVTCLTLAGCSNSDPDPNVQDWGSLGTARAIEVKLPDGGTVVCVVSKNGYSGGLSCDWDHVNRKAG